MKRILVVDDEKNIRTVLKGTLQKSGFTVDTAGSGEEALEAFTKAAYNLVITDLKMPGLSGIELLGKIREKDSHIPVILITAFGTVEDAVSAMKLGAYDFISKPFDNDEIRMIVNKAANVNAVSSTELSFPLSREGREIFIGESPRMREVWDTARKSAASDAAVLIMGETGTGKELVAESVHLLSARKDNAIIKVNCAALPDTLLESELFGYEKGAFTGAASSKPGRFELADKGTIFLDEIGDISQVTQVKLLRILQEKEFERLGGIDTKKVDIRIVTATNRNLPEDIKNGKFREDLYYRLNIIPIQLPPLRDRRDDIPALVNYFLARVCKTYSRPLPAIDAKAMSVLKSYDWPGNIRQLENFMERIIVLGEGDTITTEQMKHLENQAADSDAVSLEDAVKKESMKIEKDLISKALNKSGGNITKASEELKISRKTLHTKINQYDIEK